MPIADCTISSRSSIRNFPQFSLSPNMALLNPWRHVTSVDLVMPYSEVILDDINVGLYPIHEPDGCLEFSCVLLISSLAILVRQPHWVQKHNLLCHNFGQWLTLKSSSYQHCKSKRYHYLLDNKDAVCRLCQPLFCSHSHCFGGLRKKTPNLKFSAFF